MPGDFEMATDNVSLMHMLRKETDLPAIDLQRFEGDLKSRFQAKLVGVDLKDRLLASIGCFID